MTLARVAVLYAALPARVHRCHAVRLRRSSLPACARFASRRCRQDRRGSDVFGSGLMRAPASVI